jgi:hypothetical protein
MRIALSFFSLFFCALWGDVVHQGEVWHGTYYEAEGNVEIAGRVEGDVYVAGTQIIISGEVTGDCIAIGGSVILKGVIGGNATVIAGQGTIGGKIGKTASILGVNVDFLPGGEIDGPVFLAGGYVDVDNTISGNIMALAGGLKITGSILGDFQGFIGRLFLSDTARIQGILKYRSSYEAEIAHGAKIHGETIYVPSLVKNLMDMPILSGVVLGSKIAAFLMNFLYTFAVGAILIRFFPKKLQNTLKCLSHSFFKSACLGVLVLFLFPLVSVALLITVIGTPFALTLMALNIISFYTMKVFAILGVSNFVFSKIGWRKNRMPTLLAGQLIYYILCFIPVLGWFVAIFFMILGLGASVLAQVRRARKIA